MHSICSFRLCKKVLVLFIFKNLLKYLVSQIYKHIVGFIGPECTNAIEAVSELTGRPEIAVNNIHFGNSPTLANRVTYPYSYGILGSTEIDVNALVALFRCNNWTRTAILYDSGFVVDYTSYTLFTEKLKGIAQVAFSSPVTSVDIPLDEVRASYARVIVSFLRGDILQEMLCVAYHMNMTYPKYQWILVQVYYYVNFTPVSFPYNGVVYTCGSEQIAAVLNRRLTTWSQQSNPTFDTNIHRFPDFCLQNFWCLATYDAVWAMALALNNSAEQLKAKGLSLTGNAYGDVSVTEVIKQQMFKLKFQGMTGEIEFNETTGFIITRESSIFQFFEESQSDKEIASYTFGNDTIKVNYTTAHFVSTNFNELYIHVSLPLAAVIILLNVAASVIIMVIHLLNTLYSHTKSIKASSVRLNNFAYAGCYLVNVATVFYTILEAFGVSIEVKTSFCNVVPCCLVIGVTLVLATVLVKTARLYYVFNAKYKRTSKHLNDTTLGAVVVVLTSLSAVFCVVWLGSDHYVRLVNKTLEQLGDNLITVMRESCQCRHEVIWVLIVAIWECVLLVACVFFAFFSSKVITMKRFKPLCALVRISGTAHRIQL